MIRMPAYLLFVIIGFSIAASWWISFRVYTNRQQNMLHTINRLGSSLNDAARIIQQSNHTIEHDFSRQMKNPHLIELTAFYSPLLNASIEKADKLSSQIDEIKLNIEDKAEFESEGKKLRDSLKKYAETILPLVAERKREHLPLLPVQNLIGQELSDEEWINSNFSGISTAEKLALLGSFQSAVLLSGNIMAQYCNENIGNWGFTVVSYDVLVSQNATRLLPGHTLRIKAGIGAFSTVTRPIITIGNKTCEINDVGFASYQTVARNKGKNTIPVVVSYKDPNTGKDITKATTVKYVVDK